MKTIDFEKMTDEAVSDDMLERLSVLVHQQLDLEDRIAETAKTLKDLNAQRDVIAGDQIPTILDSTGLSEIRLSDGTKVIVAETLRVSVGKSSQYRPAVIAWLEREGHDDIIKDTVTALFNKGEGAKAEELLQTAAGFTAAVDRDRSVNAQTFAALLRECMENGTDVPLDELGVFVQREAKLKRP